MGLRRHPDYKDVLLSFSYGAELMGFRERVFLLGPSHHAYINGIALSPFEAYSTPLGDIPLCIDSEFSVMFKLGIGGWVLMGVAIGELRQTGCFTEMEGDVDEEEHSLEMHLPYMRLVFGYVYLSKSVLKEKVMADVGCREGVKLVPLLVGHPSETTLARVNVVLEKYWRDEGTFFIISSDFCHWSVRFEITRKRVDKTRGTRFSHTPYYPNAPSPLRPVPPVQKTGSASVETPTLVKRFSTASKDVPVWKSIQYMDHEGMDILRSPVGAKKEWEAYLDRTKVSQPGSESRRGAEG